MTREEKEQAIEYIKKYKELDAQLYQAAPFAIISEDVLTKYLRYWDMAIEALEQKSKTGHWIIIDDCEQFIAKCSVCGRLEDSRMVKNYPYCHCGAKMENGE